MSDSNSPTEVTNRGHRRSRSACNNTWAKKLKLRFSDFILTFIKNDDKAHFIAFYKLAYLLENFIEKFGLHSWKYQAIPTSIFFVVSQPAWPGMKFTFSFSWLPTPSFKIRSPWTERPGGTIDAYTQIKFKNGLFSTNCGSLSRLVCVLKSYPRQFWLNS